VTVGGGGGTFVTVDQKPLVVASGGDGEAYSDNPWSQPIILPLSGGSYAGLNLFLDDTGTYFTRLEVDSSFQTICTSLYEYDGVNWNSTFLFPGDICMHVNKTLGVAYSFNWLDAYTVRANDWSYINGAWTKITYSDLTIPFLGNPGNFFGIQVSGNGETLRIVSQSNSTWAMYKRIGNQWVFVTSLSVEVYNGMSYDGNRVINFGYGSVGIYDYPWTSPPIEYIIPDPAFTNNNCRISPDGTLLVTFSNVYSLSDGSFVTSLPGYVYGPQANLNISKDNKTIIKGFIGSEHQVLDYPFTKVNAVLSPVSAYSFYGSPLLNETGSVLIGSDISEGTDVYYKSFTSQPGLFLPSGTGGGDSGAGFYGNGSQIDPYFQFLFPTSYVNGGFGNSYQYGNKEEGGFGGGQGPLNKFNELTQFTISESPGTFSLGGSPTVVSVNSDATVMYYGTTRYLYSGGSWNYDQDFVYLYGKGFLSVSDDGMTAVSYPTQGYFFYDNTPLGIVAGTQLYVVNGVIARVNKQGTRVVYATYPGPNVYIRDAPFSGGDYQLTLPPSLPSTSNVTSLDFSSDGTVLAIGISTGPGGYISTTLVLVTRYPWTTYETVGPPGNIAALSPDGQTLFTAVYSSDASFIYKYNYTSQSQWQLVSQTKTGYKNTVYLATGSDGSLFVKPSDISLNFSGYPSIVFNFTAYNDDFSQVGSLSNSYVSNMSSDGQHLVNYDGSSLNFYTKQTITADTLVDHGFPHSYQAKYELTANYNGIHDITVTSANTFTFQGFCVADESGNLGAVAGVETGISGGGGYTGSPGDGVSGATCYADPVVKNFTDLGATSNTAGYVTVSLMDPAPLKQTWTWDSAQEWSLTNQIGIELSPPVWSSSLAQFVVVGKYGKTFLSPDGVVWSIVQNNLGASYVFVLVSSPSGILLAVTYLGAFRSLDGISWSSVISASITSAYSIFANNLFILHGFNVLYTSPDGITWTTITPNIKPPQYKAYGNNVYVGAINGSLYNSSDLTTWSVISDSNVVSSSYGWVTMAYENGVFVALRKPFAGSTAFYTKNSSMSPIPPSGMTPLYNVTSLTFTGSWSDYPPRLNIGDIVTFSGITGGFAYTISPATTGTITSFNDSSVTISIVSSTISGGSNGNNIQLPFVYNGTPTNYIVVTSTNGADWYGRTAPSGPWGTLISGGGNFIGIDYYNGIEMSSQDNGVTWALSTGIKGATTGVYSPTLKYFILTNQSIFYASLDGQIIVPVISGGAIGNPLQLVWADTLGIIVAVTSYSILTSSDGINWTLILNLKPDGSGQEYPGATVSWSRELGILLAYFCNNNTSNSPLLYTSTDGITWTSQVLAQPFTILNVSTNPCKPCWSPELGLFTIGEAISWDGINWVFGSGASAPALLCAAWSPELKLFVGAKRDTSYYSSDGATWTSADSSMFGYISSIAWSPTLKLFVGVGEIDYSSAPFFIYNSSDGKNWTRVYLENMGYALGGCVVWSPELSLFVVQYRFGNSSIDNVNMLTSTNGSTWSVIGITTVHTNSTISDMIWSPELKIFTSSTLRDQPGMYNSATATKTF
jgi:hypothetical protein